MKTKIKLPLMVDECNDKYRLLDQRGNPVCSGFHNPETAQLFADCFSLIYVIERSRKAGEWIIPLDMPMECSATVLSVLKRAAEAVEE